MNRRELLSHSIPALGTISFLPTFLRSNSNTDEDLLAEAGLIRELDTDSFGWIWSILRNITKEELDWKINPEANSIRWILGHLTWFEEWACDAIEEKGLYLIDKQPTNSFQSDDFEEMRNRFTAAREKYKSLTNDLSAGRSRGNRFTCTMKPTRGEPKWIFVPFWLFTAPTSTDTCTRSG